MMIRQKHAGSFRMIAVLLLALVMMCSGFTSAYAAANDEDRSDKDSGIIQEEELIEEELEEDDPEAEFVDEEDGSESDESEAEDEEDGEVKETSAVRLSSIDEPKNISSAGDAEGIRLNAIIAQNTSSSKLAITDISYDPDEKEVEFRFNNKVQYKTDSEGKDVSVKIYTDDNKKNQATSVKKYATKKITVNSKKLKYGYKYKFSISGVKIKGTKKFVTITGTFRAIK